MKDYIFYSQKYKDALKRSKNIIEYSNTDTKSTDDFFDKASIWFNTNFIFHDEYGVISNQFDSIEEMIEDFKNYILKGE